MSSFRKQDCAEHTDTILLYKISFRTQSSGTVFIKNTGWATTASKWCWSGSSSVWSSAFREDQYLLLKSATNPGDRKEKAAHVFRENNHNPAEEHYSVQLNYPHKAGKIFD